MDPYRFVPSDRTAATVDEFVAVCRDERGIASEHLYQGHFEPWLRAIGRADLAETAAQVRQNGQERDQGLEQFIQAASATVQAPPARARARTKSTPAAPPATAEPKPRRTRKPAGT